ncbi:MAG TPA: hypothetical protein PKI32_03385 [Opitutales bacterium]|nr:hypothetical protein [Opitutales bacterium]
MALLSRILKRRSKAQVSASNAAGAAPAKREPARPKIVEGEFPHPASEIARAMDEARKVMDTVGGDETLLLRSGRQLALMRVGEWLKCPDESCELKDIVASLQKLADMAPDASTTAKEYGADEAEIARIRSDLNLF